MNVAFGMKLVVLAFILVGEAIGLTLALWNRRPVPIRRAPRGTVGTEARDGPLLIKGNALEMAAVALIVLTNNDLMPTALMGVGIGVALVLSLGGLAVLLSAVRRRMDAGARAEEDCRGAPRFNGSP